MKYAVYRWTVDKGLCIMEPDGYLGYTSVFSSVDSNPGYYYFDTPEEADEKYEQEFGTNGNYFISAAPLEKNNNEHES